MALGLKGGYEDGGSSLEPHATLKASLLLLILGAILCSSVLAIVFATNELISRESARPEIVLPVVVIVGVVALLATLMVAAAIFGLFKISDREQALGLPVGSVQAVIALGLILIFAVVALYASNASGTEEFESTGLTQQEFEAIPNDEIVEMHRTGNGNAVAYDVVRSVEDRDLKEINLQLLTTVSTLVVAVAAFYFGAKTVQEGSKAVSEAAIPRRTLAVASPSSPYGWPKGAKTLLIRVRSVPPNAQLRWSVTNDRKAQLLNLEDGSFEYTPGERLEKGGAATLRFEQVDDPTVSAHLVVEFRPPTTQSESEVEPGPHEGNPA